jgi:cardiolipin synthase
MSEMNAAWHTLRELWPTIAAVLHTVIAILASSHAVLTKEEPRAAIGWVGLIWLSPFLGAFLYYVLGINRIRRKAVAIKAAPGETPPTPQARGGPRASDEALRDMAHLVLLGDQVEGKPLLAGNAVSPLVDGDAAYPAMLAAIEGARTSIALASYIFDNDDAGAEFAAALGRAVQRGVEVRVLIDATGVRYSWPTIVRPLKHAGVRVALFLPNFRLTKIAFFNLRTHRKILVVDGRVGFTGGMNIRAGNLLKTAPRAPVQDLHFKVEGPVVAHLMQTFVEDWAFTTKEVLAGETWLPPLAPAGEVSARGVKDGPDKDFEKLLWTVLGAIASARRSIRIVTPYFLPDPAMIRFLGVAAMSGVAVDIILPERSNIRFVQWASMAMVGGLLERGCRIHLAREPFDHSKLMIVDDLWAFIGSANWDARSLRLNFEFNIECYSRKLAAELTGIFVQKLRRTRELQLADVRGRGLAVKLRDGVMRLGSPYL